MHRTQSNQNLGLGKEANTGAANGLRKISSNLMDLLKHKQVHEPSNMKQKSRTRIDIYDAPPENSQRLPTPRSVNIPADPRYSKPQRSPSGKGPVVSREVEKLLIEAGSINHIKKDLSHVPNLKTYLDKTSFSVTGNSVLSRESHLLNASINDIKSTVENCERQKYENVLKKQLVLLLTALEFTNADKIVTSDTTIEFLALEIRRKILAENKSPNNSSRIIKKVSNSYIDDPDESQREMRRLKELVVKLQNEINEYMKKSSSERVKELYEDNLNYQRKIADLIDQLRRKEQEILLIPVGKVAQERIDAVKAENAELKKQLDELKKKYDQDLAEFSTLKKSLSRTNGLFPSSAEVFLDPHLLLTVVEQKQALMEFEGLVGNLRAERNQFETAVKNLESDKGELQKRVAHLENLMVSAGVDLPEMPRAVEHPSAMSVQETPRGVSEERFELSHQLENLMTLKSQLNKIKDEITKSG